MKEVNLSVSCHANRKTGPLNYRTENLTKKGIGGDLAVANL